MKLEVKAHFYPVHQRKSKEKRIMGFLAAFLGLILLLVLFVVAVTVSTVTGTFGAIADDMNEDKG